MASRLRRAARCMAVTAPLLVLAACASAPPGHHAFSVGAGDHAVPAQWTLDGLPSRGRIVLRGHTRPESAPSQVSGVRIVFDRGEGKPDVVTLAFGDRDCTGAYAFYLEHRREWREAQFEYFDRHLPWGAEVVIVFDWNTPDRMDVDIAGVGKTSVPLAHLPSRVVVSASAGGLRADDLELEAARGN